MKKQITKYCLICNKSFQVLQYRTLVAKYCSRKCQHLSLKIPNLALIKPKTKKICLFCSRKFEVFPCRKISAKFCSISCCKKWWWKQPTNKRKIIKLLKGKHSSPKTEFKPGQHPSSKTEFRKGQHPSKATEFKKGNKIPKGKKHPAFKHGKTNNNYCIDCGKKLKNIYAKRCQKCYGKLRSSKIVGKNNPMYIDGLSHLPYTLEFNKILKEQIRYRDGYKCQICGCHEVECNRKLHVHHIDYNKKNCNINNLISLCINCHTKTNANRDYWYAYFSYIMEKQRTCKIRKS